MAVGLYGTDTVAVIETENDTLLGAWDSNPSTTNGRVHAGVFSQDAETLYLLSDTTGQLIAMAPRTGAVLWSMPVPGAHEIVVSHNNKSAFVSRRTLNQVALVDLESRTQMKDLFDEVAGALHKAALLKPIVVLDGGPSSLTANHRRNLDVYIAEARQKMYSIREELEK